MKLSVLHANNPYVQSLIALQFNSGDATHDENHGLYVCDMTKGPLDKGFQVFSFIRPGE